jgi:8-oxo-dGTP diphosphatase
MPILGVATVALMAGQVLLIRREDLPMWGWPAGAVEDGESIPQAAVREVREETGLDVTPTRLTGLYSRPRWFQHGDHLAVFAGQIAGGTLRPDPQETREARFFGPAALPEGLLWWYRPIIAVALAGAGGSCATTLDAQWPFPPGIGRAAIYAMRDRGSLPPDLMTLLWQHPVRKRKPAR